MRLAVCLVVDDPSAESGDTDSEHENVIPVNAAGCEVDDCHGHPENYADQDGDGDEPDAEPDEGVCGRSFGWCA